MLLMATEVKQTLCQWAICNRRLRYRVKVPCCVVGKSAIDWGQVQRTDTPVGVFDTLLACAGLPAIAGAIELDNITTNQDLQWEIAQIPVLQAKMATLLIAFMLSFREGRHECQLLRLFRDDGS